MNLDENIKNAVVVLQKTYESVYNLLEQCRAVSEDYGYLLSADKFLRWRSDVNTDGWLLSSMILVFQKASDPACPSGNGWRDGPLYGVQVFLGSGEEPGLSAQLYAARYDYEDINSGWTDGPLSPADHWAFYNPTHEIYSEFRFKEESGLFSSKPVSDKYVRQYWGLRGAVWKTFPLSSVTSENLGKLVFGTFDELK